MIHLYGNFELPGSFREVSEGMEMAVRATGRLSNKTAHDRAEVGGFRTRVEEGSVALICGWPMALRTVCMVPQHRSRWLLLAPNSFGIPEDLKKFLLAEHLEGRRLTGFLAPSLWACDVLRGLGLPVVHAPHGVEPSIMRPAPRDLTHAQDALFDRGHFNVAHVTSSNKRRKGTLELLEAWRTFALEEPGAKLVLYGNVSFLADYQRMIRRSGARNVTLVANTNNPKSTIVGLYHSAHLIAQPSLAEGFGLVPLESLACGTPVLATACSGHADYLDGETPGAVVVPHGPIHLSDDFGGSLAYSVSSASVLDSLREARENWKTLREQSRDNALVIARDWSWTRVCRKAIEEIDDG